MIRKYFFILFLLLAQVCNAISLKGRVCDFKTHNDVVGATVTLMTLDSTVISYVKASSFWMDGDSQGYTSEFYLEAPNEQNVTYIIKAEMEGYEQTCVNYTLGKIGKNEYQKIVPDIFLKQESKMLNEVVVSSTKVKFYHKGDTIVYNASAFVLAEGSMLDALVRQLPGVEMRDNGDIYHNGKLVENLLLNGKEFFKNKQTMLDNLPTYMVKNIKIYDKSSEKAEFLGLDDPSLKSYVMDVCLKKEYSIGWISNTEAGSGVSDMEKREELPYLGRLFAMRFTDHSSIALYGNANNLNDNRRPGRNDAWKPSDLKEGIKSEQLAGVKYNIDSRDKKWKLGGELNFSHFNSDNATYSNKINYLTTGNNYERINNAESAKNWHIDTSHEFTRTWSGLMLRVRPNISYTCYDNSSNLVSKAFTTDSVINRYNSEGLTKGYSINSELNVNSTVKFNNTSDYLDWKVNANYTEKKDDIFNRYLLYYGDNAEPSNNGYQYYRNKPNQATNAEVELAWNHIIGHGWAVNLKYNSRLKREEQTSSLFLMDKLKEYDEGKIGLLPSVMEYEQCIDSRNSYNKDYVELNQTLTPRIMWHHSDKTGSWYCQATVPMTLSNQKVDYVRGAIDTTLTKNPFIVNIPQAFCEWESKDETKQLFIEYNLKGEAPNILYHINMCDDTDPLNRRLGNDKLNSSYTHQFSCSFYKESQIEQSYYFCYRTVSNAISMGYLYDEFTGIRTYKPCNVNGNFDIEGKNTISFNLDGNKYFNLDFTTTLQHVENVDLIGSAATNQMGRSRVLTEKASEHFILSYERGNNSVKLMANADYKKFHSTREHFKNMNVWDFGYGVTANLVLSCNVQLSTDITMYSRRGYAEPSMNTNDLVWNARLSKSMMKGNLLLMLDGFDILGNLSNKTWLVNGQGRTEIRRNVMPQYGMFHVQYRFNKQPKK